MHETLGCGLHELKFAQDSGTMTFSGYGAVFGNIDRGGDVIERGAFSKSLDGLKSAGTLPSMFYNHGKRGGGPDMPVGVWTSMAEDSHGLRVEGKLSDTALGRDLYTLLKDGAVKGLSIGYTPDEVQHRQKPEEPKRRLKSVGLVEVSLVNDPMNPRARVENVKSADEIITIRDLEDALRDAGWSKSQAVAVCARFQAKSTQGEPDAEEVKAVADALRGLTTRLR
jgi:HK97 family phage prohead protease